MIVFSRRPPWSPEREPIPSIYWYAAGGRRFLVDARGRNWCRVFVLTEEGQVVQLGRKFTLKGAGELIEQELGAARRRRVQAFIEDPEGRELVKRILVKKFLGIRA